MAWFTGDYVWQESQHPYRIEIHLSEDHVEYIDSTEDYVYQEAWFDGGVFAGLGERTAGELAHERAASIRKKGVRIRDTHYPVHTIQKVVVQPCEWVEVEKKVTVKEWEVIPKVAD